MKRFFCQDITKVDEEECARFYLIGFNAIPINKFQVRNNFAVKERILSAISCWYGDRYSATPASCTNPNALNMKNNPIIMT